MPRRPVGPLEEAVTAALADAPTQPRDGATRALAAEYARLMDDAAPAAKYAEPLRVLGGLAHDDAAVKALRVIELALAQHSVASDLGPKLLAAMTALLMTPAARVTALKPGEKGGARDVPSKLNALRDEVAAQRRKRAGADGA
ncbi:hypothetical protein O7635_05320 [Asanoa sp. WMMD1127]|uniref:hypothetical protein n=1 Tax=Asanoa sp. WMMD1127 TaxID=3016107 RepID=UPI002416CE8B|nr:hypothetical protein [Asanoa sp. WMMD1127]MDG4821272.1 hypothetical protein [Asanoa sp. WMMD1127]